jgi:hypothetical protein
MSIIGLLVALLVGCIVLWAARALMAAFSIGDPISTVVYVLLVLIFLFWILSATGLVPGGLGGGHALTVR